MFGFFKPEDAEAIRKRIESRLRESLPDCSLAVNDADAFSMMLIREGSGNLNLNLHNVVADIKAAWSAKQADQIIGNYVEMARQSLYPPKISLDSVYAALRHRGYLILPDQDFDANLLGDGPGDLASIIVADLGAMLVTVSDAVCREADLLPGEVRKAAEANFLALLPELFTDCPAEGVLSVGLDGYPWLGNGLLMVPKVLEMVFRKEGWSRALICAPTRETVDMADADDPNSISCLAEWMAECRATDPRIQSDLIFTMALGDQVPARTHRCDVDGTIQPLV